MSQANDTNNVLIIKGQFIRDLSFENFKVGQHSRDRKNNRLDVNIQINISETEDNNYLVILKLDCKCLDQIECIYLMEIEYGGIFEIKTKNEKIKNRILTEECPRLLFPFLRKIAHEITRDGGATPLNLQPLNLPKQKWT